MPNSPSNLPGKGLFGWLGRQIGYVSGAVKASPGGQAKPKPVQTTPPPKPAPPKVIYRDDKVEEVPHPTQPGVVLRRTIIDEVVVDEKERPAGDSTAR